MLKKLLRYDFKAVLKYWWIAALSSVVLSLGGGWCITIFYSDKNLPEALYIVATLLMTVVVLGLVVFMLLSVILVFSRFYKNFFTDEGYLTFTLPVKRTQLLNSKLITSTSTSLLTGIVIIIDILVMLCIGFADEVFTKEFWYSFVNDFLIEFFREEHVGYYIAYFIELLVLFVLYIVFTNLFMFCCITVGSLIAKKAKVLASIGIYYGANSVFTFILQTFWLFGIDSLISWVNDLPSGVETGVVLLILLGLILFMAIFCSILYLLQYWMLDRKLNLS